MLHKKRASKRFRNCKKRLRQELNPQLSWLTTVGLCGFDRNEPQKMTGVSCLPSASVPSTHCNVQTKAAIN